MNARQPVPRLKVLFVIVGLDIGGAEQQLTELLLRIDRAAFEPVVCCLGRRGPLADAIERAGIRVEVIGLGRVNELGVRDVAATARRLWRLRRLMRRERPHIVIGLLFWAYVAATLAARAARVPVVLTTRLSLGHFKAQRPALLRIERVVNGLTDRIVANAEAVRADAIRQEALPPEKVVVIRNGVEISRFSDRDEALRDELGVRPDATIVGIVANLIHYKGHRYFLDAWAQVIAKHPQAVAVLVGDGPLRDALTRQAVALGLGQSLRLLGTRRDVPRILAGLDVVAHPSLEEGSANAILEALASAKPVVATAVGGNVEAVVHEQTGLLVPAADVPALAGALCRLIEHPAEAAAFGRAGRDLVRDLYDMDRMVADYERLFVSCWQQHAPAAAPGTGAAGLDAPGPR